MATEEYPRQDNCADCGQLIYVFLSQRTGQEYACNSNDPTTDFHKHRYTWAGQSKLPKRITREDADIEQATGNCTDARTTEPDPEAPKSSFIIEEITATVNRKVGNNTILGLPAHENIDFRATLRAELFRGANVQQVFRELYAEGNKAIDKQLEETRRKFASEAIRKP